MQILIKRKVDGPSVPELGTPTSVTFDSITVPLNRPSTGPAALAQYELQRSLDGSTWSTIATGAAIFGNPAAQFVDGGRIALTTYYYRARALDVAGRASAYSATVSATTAATVLPSTLPLFPRVASIWNGGPQNYELASFQAGAATFDLVMFGIWENWGIGRSMSFAQACANIKALNPDTQIYQYQMSEAPIYVSAPTALNPVLYNAINNSSRNWWVRNPWPSGPISADVGFGASHANVTDLAANPLNGQIYHEWLLGTYFRDMFVLGSGTWAGTAPANPHIDGLFLDNVWLGPQSNGDWNCDGVIESKNSIPVSESWRRGYKRAANAFKASMPSLKILANSTQLTMTNAPASITYPEPIMTGAYDGGLLELIVGEPWSEENFRTGTVLLQAMAKHATFHSDLTLQIVNGWRASKFPTTNFQDFRHLFALVLCGSDGYVAYSDGQTFGSSNGSDLTAKRFDEYDNAGAQRQYLGAAVEAKSTGAWTQGVFRRRFANGWVLWNPRGNGVRTVSLGQSMKKIQGRSGFSDTTVNNGATVTSVTLQDRDGLVLLNA